MTNTRKLSMTSSSSEGEHGEDRLQSRLPGSLTLRFIRSPYCGGRADEDGDGEGDIVSDCTDRSSIIDGGKEVSRLRARLDHGR